MAGCATVSSKPISCKDFLPPWATAGAEVAAELDRVCPIIKDADGKLISTCPAIDEWLGRLDKYKQQVSKIR